MVIFFQPEGLDLNQSNVITLNRVQISINECYSARITTDGLFQCKMTR